MNLEIWKSGRTIQISMVQSDDDSLAQVLQQAIPFRFEFFFSEHSHLCPFDSSTSTEQNVVEISATELTGRIIGAALRVHQVLGPGFLESVYEEALCLELDALGISYERQKTIPIRYRGRKVGEHRPVLVVSGRVVVALIAIRELANIHFATARSYMKASGLASGMIPNVATMPLTVKRVAPGFHPMPG